MVFLCNISIPHLNKISFPVGLSYIAKALQYNNIPYKIVDLTPIFPKNRESYFISIIENVENAIFGFGIIIGNSCLKTNIKFASIVKKISPNNTIVFGGPLSTAIPYYLLNNTCCDYVVMGEAEERFPNLVKNIYSCGSCQYPEGVYSKSSRINSIIPTKKIEKVKKLDTFSPPSYDKFDMKFYTDYYRKHDLCFEIMASRGCYANCFFCYKFIGQGYHSRTAISVFDEIQYIYDKWGFDKFTFLEENLLQNKDVLIELTKIISNSNINFKFRGSSRIDDINDNILEILSDANVLSISFGFESLNQKTLNSMNKKLVVKDYEKKIKLLQKKGISVRGSFIIGFPNDSEDDFNNIYNFINNNGIKGNVNFLTPLVGSVLYNRVKNKIGIIDEWDYIQKLDHASLYRDLVVNLTSLPNEILTFYYNKISKILFSYHKVLDEYKNFMSL